LLTGNATITKGLVIGDAVTIAQNAFIRSDLATNVGGMAFSGTQQGFILRSDGQVLFGNSSNFVKWNNSALQIQGNITGGRVGVFDIKTTGLPPDITEVLYSSRVSIRNYTSGGSDIWITDNQSFNQGSQEFHYGSGLAVNKGFTGLTSGAILIGNKAVSGNTETSVDFIMIAGGEIKIKNRDYIPSTIDGVTISNTATVPAADFNASTKVLTIFLP
jgi:hypothetical protein